jgi:long-chain fatty acid transport protein
MVADTQGFAANYYNPAGLVFAPGTELALGYLYAWQKLRTNGRDNGVDPVRGTVAIPARGRHEPLVS